MHIFGIRLLTAFIYLLFVEENEYFRNTTGLYLILLVFFLCIMDVYNIRKCLFVHLFIVLVLW